MNITYRLIIETVLALLLCGIFAGVWTAVRRARFKPVAIAKEAELFAVIAAAGNAEGLEQTVGGLLYHDAGGDLRCKIVIADFGLEEEAKNLARLLARGGGRVIFCGGTDLPGMLEDCGWRAKNT